MATPAAASSPDVVISQVYGGGGNSGATYQNDFVELFNRGTASVSLAGWSLQYTSATGTGNFGSSSTLITALSGAIASGQYILVAEASTAAVGSPLPTADITDATPINMSATGGKVALVNTTTPLGCNGGSTPCTAAALATIVDLIGYDGANFFEGAVAAPTLSNTTAALRANGGCVDTDNNGADFTAATPTPRNSASPVHFCAGDVAPAVATTSPTNGATGVAVASNITITFTEPVNVASGWYDITCASGSRTATVTGGPTTFTLDPATDFAADENCTVTVVAATVTDQDTNDPPDTMVANFVFSFHTFVPPVAIHDIQGTGRVSPKTGLTVTTTGIVTARKSNGFFLQAPDAQADADPNTSEGIFVFTSSTPSASAAVGNSVSVTAKVQDFIPSSDPLSPPVTELSGSPSITVLSTGNSLPSVITLTSANYDPNGGIDQLVKYEGMLVRINDALTVVSPSGESQDEPSATSTTTGAFYATFPSVARPFREPGIETPEPNPPSGSTTPHIPTYDANPERVRIDTSGLGASKLDVTTGAVISGVVGALDFIFRSYSIYLTQSATLTQSGISAALPVRLPQPYEFTVSSANMERFFDTVDDPSTSDAVLSSTALNNRLNKASLEIRNVLHSPDIIGVEEMENLSNLQALANKINNDAVAAGDPNPMYVAYLEEGNDVGGIDSGFLVRSTRVNVTSVTQYGKDATYIDPNTGLPFIENGKTALLNDRPPLVLIGQVHAVVGPDYPVIVIVNHLRSLSGLTGTDAWRIGNKRRAQAEYLANLIQGYQSADPSAHVISIGDYNAYQFNDGYVDSIGTIKGTPTPADQVELASHDLVNPDLIDLVDSASPDQRYSFMFDGNAQELDHVLITQNLSARVDGLQYARNNADFGAQYRNDPNRPERISDHDPIVSYFSFPPYVVAPANVSAFTGGGATICGASPALGSPTTFGALPLTLTRAPSGGVFPVGTTTVTWTLTDGGGSTATATQTVSVTDDTRPLLVAPAPIARQTGPGATTATVFVSDADLAPQATDNCPGIAVTTSGVPAGNLFPIGTTTVSYSATDSSANTSVAATTVTIIDNTPPLITAPADILAFTTPTTCTATNVTLGVPTTSDNSGGAVTVTGPSGGTFPLGSTTVVWTATDASGNSASATQMVTVADDVAPVITAPANLTRSGTGVTTFVSDADLGTATVSDNCGLVTVIRTGVPAGNLFPQGTTVLTYTATDGSGNTASATQTVTIAPTSVSVCATVRSVVSNAGEANSLCAKLSAAADATARGNVKAHDNQLQAFVNEVNAQRGKAIADADADRLIGLAGTL